MTSLNGIIYFSKSLHFFICNRTAICIGIMYGLTQYSCAEPLMVANRNINIITKRPYLETFSRNIVWNPLGSCFIIYSFLLCRKTQTCTCIVWDINTDRARETEKNYTNIKHIEYSHWVNMGLVSIIGHSCLNRQCVESINVGSCWGCMTWLWPVLTFNWLIFKTYIILKSLTINYVNVKLIICTAFLYM